MIASSDYQVIKYCIVKAVYKGMDQPVLSKKIEKMGVLV